jgi:hypothetical protein
VDDALEDGMSFQIELSAPEEQGFSLRGELRQLHPHFAAGFEGFAKLFERETGKGLPGEVSLPCIGDPVCSGGEILCFSGHSYLSTSFPEGLNPSNHALRGGK